MREDMPDKDITLGEVYRAVLSLKEEFVVTRKEISDGHNALREEQTQLKLELAASQAEIRFLKDRVKTLEQQDPPQSTDPMARLAAGAGTGIAAALAWWLSRGQ